MQTETIQQYKLRWYHENKLRLRDSLNERAAKHREKNREKLREVSRNSYYANKEDYAKRRKEHYEKNRLAERSNYNAWAAVNREKINDSARRRRKENPNVFLRGVVRRRTLCAVRKFQQGILVSTEELVGCSIDFLVKYIEKKFADGMNWQNHGQRGWHIDHIKPLSAFDLTKKEELLKASHYTNLQPLWWKDNISKNNKYAG